MSGWRTVAVPSVRSDVLRKALEGQGVDWGSADHVTATTSLASALRNGGSRGAAAEGADPPGFETHAMPIATLIDLLVLPGWPDEWRLPLTGFPTPRVAVDYGVRAYDTAVRHWQQQASGRRMRMGITFDDCLRRVARSGSFTPYVARAVVSARRDVSRSVQTLIAAGVAPAHLEPTDDVTRLALAAWAEAEKDLTALAAHRRDLWIDPKDVEQQSDHARSVMTRLRAALEAAFGPCDGVRTLVHHGFYFYTPPQWALFQLLHEMPDVEQCFVVQDDGTNPCFESWRRFFRPDLNMPEPTLVSSPEHAPTDMALALRRALAGEPVDAALLQGALQIVECRSPAEFVRELNSERRMVEGQRAAGEPRLRTFAADKDSVERYEKRLGRTRFNAKVDLAHLPVGRFLLALHGCIRPGTTAKAVVDLSPHALMDIATSGFLTAESAASGASSIPALRRALPYFQGCSTAEDWTERAEQLLLLVQAEVRPLGERRAEDSDVERIAAAVHNPTRMVPWADLSAVEAQFVRDAVVATVAALEAVASRERVRLGDHLQFIREHLQRGMRDVPQELRDQVAAQLEGFGIGLEVEVEADGLIDVVALLLGREVAPEIGHEPDPDGADFDHLRGVDALGYARQAQSIHIANLADTAFPGRLTAVGWPFTLDHLRNSDRVQRATVEILATRTETAALSDLYLFWLALDGVDPGKRAVLSWISDVAGDPRNPSALLTLLMDPAKLHDEVRRRTGGVPVEHVASGAERESRYAVPLPEPSENEDHEVRSAVAGLPAAAAASAVICSRRFAIQWALGPSAAFQAEHHHTMLYGNVYGALVRGAHMSEPRARELCDDLWAFLTPGQRASSRAMSRIKPTRGSRPLWRLTLRGAQDGPGEFDRAYQLAMSDGPVPVGAVAGRGMGVLPDGTDNEEACRHCPVRSHCSQARDRED